ncbi:MAG: DUF4411 family protein [Gammaproteobacteria bacterium AqS3]|nr:DUF4411 family protein [Gammaproteobacteria bacterium AqS3]
MTYVFDSGPLIVLFGRYYRGRFPSLWDRFDLLVEEGRITSVREVKNELLAQDDDLNQWCRSNPELFVVPNHKELQFVGQIFSVKNGHFQSLIKKQDQMRGRPVADPFVIARAARGVENSCVVTLEAYKENAAKIPNVCKYFKVDCMNLEQFMETENWRF